MRIDQYFEILAGGPGSGRHPGFGEGRRPGSGRPFGVKSGYHKVLTEAGYEHKGSPKTGQALYQHPETGMKVRLEGDKWTHHDAPMDWAKYYATGSSARGLQSSLQYKHSGGSKPGPSQGVLVHRDKTIAAGGPGSGRRPGTYNHLVNGKPLTITVRHDGWAKAKFGGKNYAGPSHDHVLHQVKSDFSSRPRGDKPFDEDKALDKYDKEIREAAKTNPMWRNVGK